MDANEIPALVTMLQAHTPLERLSNMEARTVFEFMQGRGYRIAFVDPGMLTSYRAAGNRETAT